MIEHRVDKTTLCSIETGRRRPGPRIAHALCKILELPEGDFILGQASTLIPDPPVPAELLRREAVAQALSVDLETVAELIDSGRLPVVRIAGEDRVMRADLDEFIGSLKEQGS